MASRLYRYTPSLTSANAVFSAIILLFAGSASHAHLDLDLPEFPLSNPDLSWKPEPFSPVVDPSARYIDFKTGSDSNPGTKDRPWKHHPWDSNATANANANANANNSKRIITYYFKQGVTYHGSLVAKESGTPTKPIHLSIDPDWGKGDATISGGTLIKSKWHLCDLSESKALPSTSRQLTWCIDTMLKTAPLGLWATLPDGEVIDITLARTPNWTRTTANDPRSEWYKLKQVFLETRLFVDSTDGFKTGDSVHPGTSPDAKGIITQIKPKVLVVKIAVEEHEKYQSAKSISNGHTSITINKLTKPEPVTHILFDPDHLTATKSEKFDDAILWIEPRRIPIPLTTTVRNHYSDKGELTARFSMNEKNAPVAGSRYYLEGLPQFLDSPGEYAFEKIKSGGIRIFLRLTNNIDPNNIDIEAAYQKILIHIKNKKHITLSGLRFRSNNQTQPGTQKALTAAIFSSAIQIRGTSSHINIHHNYFDNLTAGIIAYPEEKSPRNILDQISITDNTFAHIDGSAIALGNGQRRKIFAKYSSRLIKVNILRNQLHDIGLLSLAQRGIIGVGGDAILVSGGEVVEIAHNHVNYSGGPGIQLVLGAEYARGKVSRPFLRGLIHHNKVINSLLSSYDFGGISAWTGGPVYIYNNISGNPVGYLATSPRIGVKLNTIQRSSYGIGIYLDGVYKAYVFNNIIWGLSNDLSAPIFNAVAFNEAIGFMHSVFHNTFYKFAVGLHRGGNMQHNRNYYMANLLIDMSHKFIQHKAKTKVIEFDSIAYTNNIFQGKPASFGQIGNGKKNLMNLPFNTWQSYLLKNDVLSSKTGLVSKHKIVTDAKNHDFRLGPRSPAIGKGVKVFIPMSLSRVVGEWNFYLNNKYPAKVFGENINMNAEWVERPMFHQIPRNDLTCPNTNPDDYVYGLLENWVKGALSFNGKDQYCKLAHASLINGYRWKTKTYKKTFSGKINASERDTVDIKTDSFIIEAVLNIHKGSTKGGIVSKRKGKGYEMFIGKNGYINITLDFGGESITRSSNLLANNGKWHHILIEFDQDTSPHLNIYISGELANGKLSGKFPANGDLSNEADFIVGHSDKAGYFTGQIDFLRVSKGTLKDAQTTINDLYKWQFNGPYLQDFSGLNTSGNRLNAGAVEIILEN